MIDRLQRSAHGQSVLIRVGGRPRTAVVPAHWGPADLQDVADEPMGTAKRRANRC